VGFMPLRWRDFSNFLCRKGKCEGMKRQNRGRRRIQASKGHSRPFINFQTPFLSGNIAITIPPPPGASDDTLGQSHHLKSLPRLSAPLAHQIVQESLLTLSPFQRDVSAEIYKTRQTRVPKYAVESFAASDQY